ncbi:NAD-dependent epimerase/dehydratase family protein [Geothrix sp.]|jgi:UDP-2-acetamido-2,6-beta-L-arabino-hexul-4-ose reductase|uniref:polysaccharide biosynthesis C-terminal domain-containing protein n=1 Tax=Geothrix sp. TaxID=1962974 RepID=UPI0025B8F23E|nr:NAD-dependent epimerase/dehydratase family protein [Geothrix sp.]
MTKTLNKIAITGSSGFLGWHLRCWAKQMPSVEVIEVPDESFDSLESLSETIGSAGVVIHLAGMNRGPEAEVYETNLKLARNLAGALDRLGEAPVILFANSTHSFGDSPFGQSKREASALLAMWAKDRGARYVDVVLPHLFGEGGRPFYNSAFATFCHQLANGEEPQILQDGRVELIHAQRAASRFMELALDTETSGAVRIEGIPMQVSVLLAHLKSLYGSYAEGIIPDLSDPFHLDCFNTLRSYLYPTCYPMPLRLHTDTRGGLFEAVKTQHGGQAFLSSTHPGITRGRHYHHRKVERFLVVSGEAEIRIRRLFSMEVQVFRVSGAEPCFVDMPTFHAHEITNVGTRDLLTLFWSHEIFNPSDSDTYPEPVILNQ